MFAVAQAGMYPIMHLGRPWLAYWLFPYPNTMGIWPQFRSPLMWDVFAVSTYATVSAMFWFVGLIPDFATLRDRAKSKPWQILYGLLAMGWRGSARHWHRYEMAYLLLAGLATPLVLSVHTIVSFDFAVGVLPGWHATIFPPYFVAGAIYAGFAMVLLLTIPLRKLYGLEGFITMRHMHNMAKVMLATGLIVGYGYVMEAFFGWYSGNRFRAVHDLEPHARAIRRLLLGPDRLQYRDAAVSLDQARAFKPAGAVVDLNSGQHRHVAGTICDCGDEPASRLPAFVVGSVSAFDVGLDDVYRHDWILLYVAVSVHSLPADDLDF